MRYASVILTDGSRRVLRGRGAAGDVVQRKPEGRGMKLYIVAWEIDQNDYDQVDISDLIAGIFTTKEAAVAYCQSMYPCYDPDEEEGDQYDIWSNDGIEVRIHEMETGA